MIEQRGGIKETKSQMRTSKGRFDDLKRVIDAR